MDKMWDTPGADAKGKLGRVTAQLRSIDTVLDRLEVSDAFFLGLLVVMLWALSLDALQKRSGLRR